MISLLGHYRIHKSQEEVDFLIPFLDQDRRFFLDPAQLRYSEDPLIIEWQKDIIRFLSIVNDAISKGDHVKLKRLLSIGESKDIGLGYCAEGHKGSGVGSEISDHVIYAIAGNPGFKTKGIERIEEIQWLDKLIGPDRVGDLTANILKQKIIEYTIAQADKVGIPRKKVRVRKVFDFSKEEWIEKIVEVPVNDLVRVIDALNPHPPVLLLPKETLKALPLFLSYDDFYGYIDPNYKKGKKKSRVAKEVVVNRVLTNPGISTQYIKKREEDVDTKLYRTNFNDRAIEIIEEIAGIKPGAKGAEANRYRSLVNELLPMLFDSLKIVSEEKATHLKENRRDGIFYNTGKSDVFRSFREQHRAHHIVVDAKNTNDVTSKDIAQVANYLDDDFGRVAIIVSRRKKTNIKSHQLSQRFKHKNIVLQFTDEDLRRWVTQVTRIQHTSGQSYVRVSPDTSLLNMYSEIMSL